MKIDKKQNFKIFFVSLTLSIAENEEKYKQRKNANF